MSRQRPNPPAKERNPGRGALPFSILSAIVSLLFIAYGVSISSASEVSRWLEVFGYVSVLYGMISLAVLGCAHKYRALWCVTISQVSSVCYLIIYILAVSAGLETGLGLSGILLVALAVWVNWFAINAVIRNHLNP
ncbi:MAG: hypothetical protein RQ722_01610 [Desulfuromonadales bacterium]|nr:hypothetical protein [Desulfuromonadales bacterium]